MYQPGSALLNFSNLLAIPPRTACNQQSCADYEEGDEYWRRGITL